MTKCEIIVIRYGLPELEQECIDSVLEHTEDVDYTLTAHDNYEADESLSKVWNDLTRESEAEYICLLNNDTRIEEKDWLKKLLESFDTIENLGAVGPVTNQASGPQGNKVWQKKWRERGEELIKTRMLVGFCMVFPKSLWEEIGGFDEEYALYAEDSDFCMELQKREYKLAIHIGVFVFHHGRSSTPIALARGKDIPALLKESRIRYRNKWFFGRPADKEKQALLRADARAAKKEEQKAKRKVFYDAVEEKRERRKRYLEWKKEKAKRKNDD